MRFPKIQWFRPVALILILLMAMEVRARSADKLAVRQKVPVNAGKLLPSVFYSLDGRSVALLESEGHLRELSLPGMKLLTERNLNLKCSAFGKWEEGFAVYADATQELIILDVAFNETGRVKMPGLFGIATAPTLDFGYVIGKNQIGIVELSKARLRKLNTTPLLRAAERVKRTDSRPAPLDFLRATCTLDGKYLESTAVCIAY